MKAFISLGVLAIVAKEKQGCFDCCTWSKLEAYQRHTVQVHLVKTSVTLELPRDIKLKAFEIGQLMANCGKDPIASLQWPTDRHKHRYRARVSPCERSEFREPKFHYRGCRLLLSAHMWRGSNSKWTNMSSEQRGRWGWGVFN